MLGYHPEVILAGRRINDSMGKFIAEQTVKHLVLWLAGQSAPIVVLGLTFRRIARPAQFRVIDVINELRSTAPMWWSTTPSPIRPRPITNTASNCGGLGASAQGRP